MILLRYLAAESYSADGKMKSYSTPEGCHSAILALFAEGRCDFNREWQKFVPFLIVFDSCFAFAIRLDALKRFSHRVDRHNTSI